MRAQQQQKITKKRAVLQMRANSANAGVKILVMINRYKIKQCSLLLFSQTLCNTAIISAPRSQFAKPDALFYLVISEARARRLAIRGIT